VINQLLTMTLESRKRQDSCLLDEIGHFFPKTVCLWYTSY